MGTGNQKRQSPSDSRMQERNRWKSVETGRLLLDDDDDGSWSVDDEMLDDSGVNDAGNRDVGPGGLIRQERRGSSRSLSTFSDGHVSTRTSNNDREAEPQLAQKESAEVSRWLLALSLMLATTAVLVLMLTYQFIRDGEQSEFKESFVESANIVIGASNWYLKNVIRAYEAFADTLTTEVAFARTRGEADWPFVMPFDFEALAAHARLKSYTETLYLVPLIFGNKRRQWEAFAINNSDWIDTSRRQHKNMTQKWLDDQEFFDAEMAWSSDANDMIESYDDEFVMDGTLSLSNASNPNNAIVDRIYRLNHPNATACLSDPASPCTIRAAPTTSFYAPIWMISPPPNDLTALNYDMLSDPVTEHILSDLISGGNRSMITGLLDLALIYKGVWSPQGHSAFHRTMDGSSDVVGVAELPHSLAITGIRAAHGGETRTVGFLAGVIPWDIYFSRLLPSNVNGVTVVLKSSCGSVNTYVINGPVAIHLGDEDLHETEYDDTKMEVAFDIFGSSERTETCEYSLSLYATKVYREQFESNRTAIFTALLGALFLATGSVFVVYVQYVQRRQIKVLATANRTNAIVSSLFPSNFRDRILQDAEEQAERERKLMAPLRSKQRLQSFLQGKADDHAPQQEPATAKNDLPSTPPIADLFPSCTVMICDIVGFTAWSSVREPADVFQLLETVFQAFDERAQRRRVYKVETVGDQYVAVVGLPDPRKDHAVVMARFAQECCLELAMKVKKLEVVFGPDTGDLSMRFGLHSGPVTAGVLRGERSRFQLFGDTVNTAARLESTGRPGRVQVSEATASLLSAFGKGHWVTPRDDRVVAKGKGELQTYWLNTKAQKPDCTSSVSGSETSSIADDVESEEHLLGNRIARLVDWNVDTLLRLLRQMAARRKALGQIGSGMEPLFLTQEQGATVLDEVREIITLPTFNPEAAAREVDPSSIDLGEDVEKQLRDYVSIIAGMYHDNPFHNFDHVSHVAMSVTKLLSRIVAPSDLEIKDDNQLAHTLHDHTYGITSDPLTQFACIFSALVHDVDHRGVSNAQLIKENQHIAEYYKNKSVAEQNSVDLSWNLLMSSKFRALQRAIFATEDELARFRQLVVNSVMATDIMDKDLKALRNARWDKAFKDESEETSSEQVNRKATIVIEHLIQASDVSHTMQHWHVYRKWNTKLFRELYQAFKDGRAEKNPAEFWAKGEIGFFDFYIIPLAKKLKDCGVFGVSSFEYLDYAQRNRDEWETKGEQIVAELLELVNANHPSTDEECKE